MRGVVAPIGRSVLVGGDGQIRRPGFRPACQEGHEQHRTRRRGSGPDTGRRCPGPGDVPAAAPALAVGGVTASCSAAYSEAGSRRSEMVQMTQEQDWENWRKQEFTTLGDLIAWAPSVIEKTEVRIAGSRHYGTALLAHSIECARAIRRCTMEGTPGPAFALARSQYEGAMRGHIMVHEMDLDELNELLDRVRQWSQVTLTKHPQGRRAGPPKIEIRKQKWSVVPSTKPSARPLECEVARHWQESVDREMRVLHDLAHSGLTHALQMLDADGFIGPCYSAVNQTLLLRLAQQNVMFAITTWPGVEQKFGREIRRRAARISTQWSIWEPYIGTPAS